MYDEDDVRLSDMEEELPEIPDLLGPCPDWCKGRPHLDNSSEYPCDQSHDSERLELEVELPSGRTELYAFAEIVWAPYSERPGGDGVYVTMVWEYESLRLEPVDLLAVADGIEGYATDLRGLAARLAEIQANPLPDQGEPILRGIL